MATLKAARPIKLGLLTGVIELAVGALESFNFETLDDADFNAVTQLIECGALVEVEAEPEEDAGDDEAKKLEEAEAEAKAAAEAEAAKKKTDAAAKAKAAKAKATTSK